MPVSLSCSCVVLRACSVWCCVLCGDSKKKSKKKKSKKKKSKKKKSKKKKGKSYPASLHAANIRTLEPGEPIPKPYIDKVCLCLRACRERERASTYARQTRCCMQQGTCLVFSLDPWLMTFIIAPAKYVAAPPSLLDANSNPPPPCPRPLYICPRAFVPRYPFCSRRSALLHPPTSSRPSHLHRTERRGNGTSHVAWWQGCGACTRFSPARAPVLDLPSLPQKHQTSTDSTVVCVSNLYT